MGKQNLTLMTDLYELTMMQGYFRNKDRNETVIFDAFYRNNPMDSGYSICAGLEQVIDYVNNLHFEDDDIAYLRSLGIFGEDFLKYLRDFHFSGDIYAIPEGSIMFPREPMIKVIAPIMEAQLVETAILNIINHQSLIATKTSRVCFAARGDGIMEFGLRRAQGPDAGTLGARAAMIGGCVGTSNVLAGQLFDVPVKGTHAHSWIMSFPDEYTAFKTYADMYPSACILLVDTYDTLKSGVPNAIRVFTEMREAGIPLTFYGIRLDGVYKLAAIQDAQSGEFIPKIKLSENSEKITNPGNKKIYRIYEKDTGKIKADLICLVDETYDENEPLVLFDPNEPWKKTKLLPGTYELRELMVHVFDHGNCIYHSPKVMDIRDYCQKELETLWEETRRLVNPHGVYVDLSQKLYDMKISLLNQMSQV